MKIGTRDQTYCTGLNTEEAKLFGPILTCRLFSFGRNIGEIILFDNQVVLYRFHEDVFFYIVGMPEENEAMLLVILNAFSDAVSMLLRYRTALADGLH